MTTEEMKPLDLSIFQNFTFVEGTVGNYEMKEVCIMSALYLATQIALGKTTLQESIMSDDDWRTLAEETDLRRRPRATDKVACVAGSIRDLCIERNDTTHSDVDRRAWAMVMMTQVTGTYMGAAFEYKIADHDTKFSRDKWRTEYRAHLEKMVEVTSPFSKEGTEIRSRLAKVEVGSWYEAPLSLEWLDARIYNMINFCHKERDRRERTNAARRAKALQLAKEKA
jgi:hypothetical protein